MNIITHIARHLIDVHEGDNWTEVNLKATLEGINVNEAGMQTPASPNTIASLLHHITYWNRVMVQRINGISVPELPDNGFDMPPLTEDIQWEQLKADNILSARELAAAIQSFDEKKLEQPILPGHSTAYKNLQGSVEHVHYHLGQIVLLKKLVKGIKN